MCGVYIYIYIIDTISCFSHIPFFNPTPTPNLHWPCLSSCLSRTWRSQNANPTLRCKEPKWLAMSVSNICLPSDKVRGSLPICGGISWRPIHAAKCPAPSSRLPRASCSVQRQSSWRWVTSQWRSLILEPHGSHSFLMAIDLLRTCQAGRLVNLTVCSTPRDPGAKLKGNQQSPKRWSYFKM